MTIDIKSLGEVIALVAALIMSPAMAQEVEWDDDDDDTLGVEEFVAGFAKRTIFNNWDRNGDELLSKTEFSRGVYDTYDTDRSGDLEESEYGAASERNRAGAFWEEAGAERNYEDWDIDGDGVILSNEFLDGWGQDSMFEIWDENGDARLSAKEFATGVFGRYDKDGSGLIEEPELTDIGDDMGDGGLWDV